MNRLLFIIGAVVVWQVFVHALPSEPAPAAQSFTPMSGSEFETHERYTEDARKSQRKSALAALDRPWSERCGAGRKQFISQVAEYYYQRHNQQDRYPEIYGPSGATYIARQWATSEDRRIERLTQEAYAAGYLAPSDFDGFAGRTVASIVAGERVKGRGCAA